MGSQESDLTVIHPVKPMRVKGNPIAAMLDHKPIVNIKPFGQCQSLANPIVASATAAANGKLQKMPCVPNTTTPWMGCKMNMRIKGNPALLDSSKLTCVWAGVIEITNPGQKKMKEGGTSLNSNTDSVQSEEKVVGVAIAAVTVSDGDKSSTVKYDPIKAVERLKRNYLPSNGKGRCARYVRWAIEAGMGREEDGENDVNHFPSSAKDFGPDLIKKVGYTKLNFTPSNPTKPEELQKGDVMIFQSPEPKRPDGHIQMWDGEKWGSDFKQPADDFWPGPPYRQNKPTFEFFRYFMIIIFALVGIVNAQNSDLNKAKKVINAFYTSSIATYDSEGKVHNREGVDIGNKKETSKYFCSEMVELLYSEYKCRMEIGGEMCREICPFLQECIDYTSKFSIVFEIKSANPTRILAIITDSNYIDFRREVLFYFVVENGEPKISDAVVDGLGSLKKELQTPFSEL